MPWWTTLMIAFGGLLLGGAWSLRQQKAPVWLWVAVAVCAVLAVIAGILLALPENG